MHKEFGQELPELSYHAVAQSEGGEWAWGQDPTSDEPELVEAELISHDHEAYAEPPPERVRFTAPVHLSLDEDLDGDNRCEGSILNLSQSGALVLVPLALQGGDRVHLRFRPTLADEPLCVPAYVVWRRVQEQQNLCGVRFLNLSDEDEQRILKTVQERASGKAGEWPLPVWPQSKTSSQTSSRSPWFSGALGVVAGVTLALVASAIPRVGMTNKLEPAQKPFVVAPTVVAVVAEKPAESAVLEVETTPALPAAPAEPTPQVDDVASDLATPIVKRAPALSRTHDGLELSLFVDGDATDVKTFWLANPNRLVVDVAGRKSALTQVEYELNDGWAQRLRSGNHADKVRFVIETSDDVGKIISTQTDGDRVLVRFSR